MLMPTRMRYASMDLKELSTALNSSLASLVRMRSERIKCSIWFCEDLANVCKRKKTASLVFSSMNAVLFSTKSITLSWTSLPADIALVRTHASVDATDVLVLLVLLLLLFLFDPGNLLSSWLRLATLNNSRNKSIAVNIVIYVDPLQLSNSMTYNDKLTTEA